ncbi:unnamed protein product [marine sediment metagenome]|uniref:Uncharacterized protein n=1 Tax=marine sediment metagenome TaxID=412755 RepID=X1JMK7_9ZZZZ
MAIRSFQNMLYWPNLAPITTVSIRRLAEEVKTSANKNWFHAVKKVNKAAAITPGKDTGKMILKKAPTLEHPSMSAASSNSIGMLAKKPLSMSAQNGKVKVR